jgi:hypothetical protein
MNQITHIPYMWRFDLNLHEHILRIQMRNMRDEFVNFGVKMNIVRNLELKITMTY